MTGRLGGERKECFLPEDVIEKGKRLGISPERLEQLGKIPPPRDWGADRAIAARYGFRMNVDSAGRVTYSNLPRR